MLGCLDLQSPVSSATGCECAVHSVTPADVFICAECQADAKQFLEIQDSIWAETTETSESSDGTDKPSDL